MQLHAYLNHPHPFQLVPCRRVFVFAVFVASMDLSGRARTFVEPRECDWQYPQKRVHSHWMFLECEARSINCAEKNKDFASC